MERLRALAAGEAPGDVAAPASEADGG